MSEEIVVWSSKGGGSLPVLDSEGWPGGKYISICTNQNLMNFIYRQRVNTCGAHLDSSRAARAPSVRYFSVTFTSMLAEVSRLCRAGGAEIIPKRPPNNNPETSTRVLNGTKNKTKGQVSSF